MWPPPLFFSPHRAGVSAHGSSSAGAGPFSRCPRQESNLDLPLRRRSSYPLDYEGAARRAQGLSGRLPARSHWTRSVTSTTAGHADGGAQRRSPPGRSCAPSARCANASPGREWVIHSAIGRAPRRLQKPSASSFQSSAAHAVHRRARAHGPPPPRAALCPRPRCGGEGGRRDPPATPPGSPGSSRRSGRTARSAASPGPAARMTARCGRPPEATTVSQPGGRGGRGRPRRSW